MPAIGSRFSENIGFSVEPWMKSGIKALYERNGTKEGMEMRMALRNYLIENGIYPPEFDDNKEVDQEKKEN